MRVLLISTYDLGHQPFGLASPAAWLRAEGHQVTCVDLACGPLPTDAVAGAGLIAFFLPMHTATRLALAALPKVREINPGAHLCCYGLYAPLNAGLLRERGVKAILGGEFEAGLADLARLLESGKKNGAVPEISLARQRFLPPDRSGLPSPASYAKLLRGGESVPAGYTEASRGCKHRCRHCPIVPVYGGAFRVVQREVVLADIRRQVASGVRHITFGDPDFFNGPGHAIPLAEALHAEFPGLTYDVTIKIEHLLRHRALLPVLRRTGCLFVTSAVESVDDTVLEKLAKHHTRADFADAVLLMRDCGLHLAPTFIPFTPWTTEDGYRDLLATIADLDLVENVAPVQWAIRLLVTAGSHLLQLPEISEAVGPFDPDALAYPWSGPLDDLCRDVHCLITRELRRRATRTEIFARIWTLFHDRPADLPDRAAIPYMTEPWYC